MSIHVRARLGSVPGRLSYAIGPTPNATWEPDTGGAPVLFEFRKASIDSRGAIVFAGTQSGTLRFLPPQKGRPPKPAREKQARHVRVPVNAAEGASLDAWSKATGRPLAALVREVALRAARRAACV